MLVPTTFPGSANGSGPANRPGTTVTVPPLPPTTIPLFSPFSCSVRISGTSFAAPAGARIVDVIVRVTTKKVPAVWVWITAGDLSRRASLTVDATGNASQLVTVPVNTKTSAKVYSSGEFLPESLECDASQ